MKKREYKTENYLTCLLPRRHRSAFFKRCGVATLGLETRRYENLQINDRVCLFCSDQSAEAEIQGLLLLDEFPTVTETTKAIQHLSSGKALGSGAISAEIYKAGGQPMAEKLTELFHYMWRKEAIPQKFDDASITEGKCSIL